ncbi:MAG: MaoC family dehydratase N-terminal domain-containing protein [Acidimicrobiia bacterium]|nr:MaoC family dehydratase N-terminal domain-containing protein [Acidimicrobiia bacterium]MCY4457532.1 MaoC/PaaZ C-terminal domain-containing protein [Acidimicrobiaceae bacterium]
MPINPEAVGTTSEPTAFTWTSKDSLLYALGVGAGATDPTGLELEFTTENSKDHPQQALPTQVVVMGTQKMPAFGDFNLAALLHGEQTIELHQKLTAEGSAIGQSKVAAIYDKGKAALVQLETTVTDQNGAPLWSSHAGLFIGGEGGWGGDRGPANNWVLPDREADTIISYDTRRDQALLYRLNGDRNPLHSDPSFSALAGFDTPILHGLCTFGFTGRALLHGRCEGNPERFKSMGGRFKSPVLPGERLDIHMWDESDRTLFQTRANNRVVFDAGVFTSH